MGDPAARASELMKKADKKLNSFGLFGGFGSKYDDAAEMYERAANQFKLAKACKHRVPSTLVRIILSMSEQPKKGTSLIQGTRVLLSVQGVTLVWHSRSWLKHI